jgi:hypothetical protein
MDGSMNIESQHQNIRLNVPLVGTDPFTLLYSDKRVANGSSFAAIKKPGKLHVILQIEDDGEPPLSAYCRAIIEVRP